ncbi:phage major capsid protein [Maridesulfovibrio ferrireducens]|uniref:phage major capsid protein n=1 Tax=Maridesulfovibrio ferrireducens TaxID=246191 RepID=UPI001A2BC808|nr:phage major capsid protein [Maridesulfovibrio ferrireducens]MBI9110284.1 phage major capsid protein [Maridesulfovibrio ferrireducens]
MLSIQALREKRDKKAAEARKLVDENPGDKWTDDTEKQFTAFKDNIAILDAEISRHEDLLNIGGPQSDDTPESVAARAAGANIEVKPKAVYKNLGEQLMDVRAMTLDNGDAPKARERFNKVVNAAGSAATGIDSEGGYLVETDHSTDILSTAIETGIFSSRCDRQPISANADGFAYMAEKDRDRSSGGLQVYRKGEREVMKDSGKLKLEEREIRVEDMYGLIFVTNRMLRDAPALAAYTRRNLRKQFAVKLDTEIWDGTGAGQCLGIMNSDLPIKVSKEAGQAANTIVAKNLAKMLSRFHGNIQNSAWFTNNDVLPELITLTLGDKPVYLPGGNIAGAPFGTLFGRPVILNEYSESLGTCGDISLCDFGEYMLIEKGGTEEEESIHVKFLEDETAFRFLARNNGAPIHDQPITPRKGTNTLSPFVMLEDRE